MLSAEHRAIVKATAPLLESGGEALTTHFYKMLISEHPEVRPMFNQANQASGSQQRALANGVLMYARHIDHLEQLGGLVSQIINKHVALNIQPEHYPIVGQCLLRSIREVLGAEIATDAVTEAWAAAYQQLADLLTGLEEKIYAERESAPGDGAVRVFSGLRAKCLRAMRSRRSICARMTTASCSRFIRGSTLAFDLSSTAKRCGAIIRSRRWRMVTSTASA
jgi:hemoglobin-like flavoprotein